jgi:hypothetical protein
MNVYVNASLEGWFLPDKNLKSFPYTLKSSFTLWQTPESVTNNILDSEDRGLTYIKWVMEQEEEVVLEVYADDVFEEGEFTGYKISNIAKEHKEALEDWLEEYKDWNIEWHSM